MPNEHEPRSPGEKSPIYPPDPLVADPVVEMLVPDPSRPPTPTVSLLGLLGRSTKEGYWRLYFSTELNRYAEFKEEDVLHSVKVPRELPPFLGMEATRVWIKRDAEIEYTRTESRRRVRAEVLDANRGKFLILGPGIIEEDIVHPFLRVEGVGVPVIDG
jgi:hypothetical protein